MPKRPVTPPIDDGAKYLTVVYPYPSRPNMEFESHRKLFVQWVAACIGSRYLRAFYHKPTSPGSILLEIDESLPDFKQILGAHKWSEFLTAPQGDDAKHVSKVFYCTYNSDRLVQKNGWKRIDIKEGWFKSKGPSKFASPYPPTRWCDIPQVGNVIQNDLCRPLPGGNFPPPPSSAPTPVVGTPEWLEYKRQRDAKVPVVRTWTRGTPPESLRGAPPSTAAGSAPTDQSALSHTTPAAQPAPRRAWANVAAGPVGSPPGLLRVTSTSSSQGSSSSGSGSTRADTPSIRAVSPLAPQSACSSASSNESGNQPLSPTDGLYEAQVTVAGGDVEGALNALSLGGEDDPDDDLYYSMAESGSTYGDVLYAPRGELTIVPATSMKESLWGDYVEEEDEEDPEDNDVDLIKAAEKTGLCRAHNRVCKKGICKIYAAQLREEEKKQRDEERRQQREGRGKPSKKKNASSDDASTPPSRSGSSTPARAAPPHLRPGAPAPALAPASRELPAHLRRGAPASAPPPSPVSPISPPAHVARAPSNNSAPSTSNGGWGSVPSGVWGPTPAKSNTVPLRRDAAPNQNAPAANPSADAASSAPALPAPPRQWGAWGRAPSISASSVQRNNDSWSISAGEKDEVQSVATSGWGTKSDRAGPWGSAASVRAAGPASKGTGAKKAWADQMDEADGRSVAGSTASASTTRTWGNVSAGPW